MQLGSVALMHRHKPCAMWKKHAEPCCRKTFQILPIISHPVGGDEPSFEPFPFLGMDQNLLYITMFGGEPSSYHLVYGTVWVPESWSITGSLVLPWDRPRTATGWLLHPWPSNGPRGRRRLGFIRGDGETRMEFCLIRLWFDNIPRMSRYGNQMQLDAIRCN